MLRLLSLFVLAGLLGVSTLVRAAAPVASNSSALINKALDEQVKLYIDKTLPEALDSITDKTGVRLIADPAVWDLLPWGRDTKIQATVENVTLREALRRITQSLGLTLVLRDDYVEVQPMAPLVRLAQRASRDELKALDVLASRPLSLETDRPTLKRLLEAVDDKLAAEKEIQLAIENRTADSVRLDKTVFVPRNATLLEALESLPKETKATWYPWGKSILIVPKETRTRRLLSKPLTIRPGDRGMDVLQILLDISTRTNVAFEFQPGVIQALPADVRIVRGPDGRPPVFDNAPAQQILEAIAAATGLSYTIQDDKVLIASAAPAPGQRDPMIGFIQLDNGMQILIPSSQVPPDLKEYLRWKMQKKLEEVREMMIEEQFKPSTQPTPTTQPVHRDL